jgi:hypothetical protein
VLYPLSYEGVTIKSANNHLPHTSRGT